MSVDFFFNLLLVLHFVGLASLLGGFIVQMKSPQKGVNNAMLHGALTQLITGVALVSLLPHTADGTDSMMSSPKWAFKVIIALIITVLALLGRKKPLPQTAFWGAIGALTLVNIVIAVYWSVG